MPRRIAIPFRKTNFDWPINIDFIPTMSLQSDLDPKQEIYDLKAHVSEITAGRPDNIATTRPESDLKFEIRQIPSTSTKFEINWGSPDPHDEERISQKELWDEIQQRVEIKDAVLKVRSSVQKVPPKMTNEPLLDGIDKIFARHIAYGNRANAVRKRLRFPVDNPYHIIRAELINRGVIHSVGSPRLKKIRSVLGTDYFLPDNKSGYNPLFPIATNLQRGLRSNKFWKDTANSIQVVGAINSDRIEGILYRLDTRPDKILAL